jgi:hypothetical protein
MSNLDEGRVSTAFVVENSLVMFGKNGSYKYFSGINAVCNPTHFQINHAKPV